MQHLAVFFAVFATATALATPASPAAPVIPTPSSPIPGLTLDPNMSNYTFCHSANPALGNAIAKLCLNSGEPLTLGNTWVIGESSPRFSKSPHPGSILIQASCDSDATGPPEDVQPVCEAVGYDLCYARVMLGAGVMMNRGKAHCQQWIVPGWDEENVSGYEYGGMEVLDLEDLGPKARKAERAQRDVVTAKAVEGERKDSGASGSGVKAKLKGYVSGGLLSQTVFGVAVLFCVFVLVMQA